MKTFCFTVDDNIRFLKELTRQGSKDLFAHPYMAMYRRLHEKFDLKVQLNLFYRMEDFDLSQMTDALASQFAENAHWLKLSFHSDVEDVRPYVTAGYGELYAHCQPVHREILRFASPESLAETTTVHYCLANGSGLTALADCGVKGLLGLFGTEAEPRTSYGLEEALAQKLRHGDITVKDGIAFAPIDIVLNLYKEEKILELLNGLRHREHLWVMIHEQYFYADYPAYQPDFEDKLSATFADLTAAGYRSCFFQELI